MLKRILPSIALLALLTSLHGEVNLETKLLHTMSVAVDEAETTLFVGGPNVVEVYGLPGMEKKMNLEGVKGDVSELVIAQGRVGVLGDKYFGVWDLEDYKNIALTKRTEYAYKLLYSPATKEFVVGSKQLETFDLNGKSTGIFHASKAEAESLAISPDGKTLLMSPKFG